MVSTSFTFTFSHLADALDNTLTLIMKIMPSLKQGHMEKMCVKTDYVVCVCLLFKDAFEQQIIDK